MKKAAVIMTLLPAINLVALSTFVFTTGAACPNVPTMKMLDVCDKMPIPEWTHVCWVTLKSSSAPKTALLTDYVIMAAGHAINKYDGTLNAINQLLRAGGKLTDTEREAISYCKDKYIEARSVMASFVHQLSRCDFTNITRSWPLWPCQDRLTASLLNNLPLFAKVTDDQNLDSVVFELETCLLACR